MINPIEKITTIYHETVGELRKCTWPGWNELVDSTLVVIASVAILTLFVGVMDWIAKVVITFLTVAR